MDEVVCPNYYKVLSDPKYEQESDVVVKPKYKIVHDRFDLKFQKSDEVVAPPKKN